MNNNQKIDLYIKKNKSTTEWRNINHLSSVIGVSPSAITRFCKLKGYKGFKDFHFIVDQYNEKNDKVDNLIKSIQKTNTILDINKINKMAKRIINSEYIYILGESFTYLQGLIFERKLLRININAKILNIASELSLILPKKNSIYIYISHSGKNKNIKKAIDKIILDKKEKMFLLSITTTPSCIIKNICNEHIYGDVFLGKEITEKELPSNSFIITQLILDVLFHKIFNLNKEKNINLLKNISFNK